MTTKEQLHEKYFVTKRGGVWCIRLKDGQFYYPFPGSFNDPARVPYWWEVLALAVWKEKRDRRYDAVVKTLADSYAQALHDQRNL